MTGERTMMIVAGAFALLLGLALRAWAITTTPLWLDEAYSAYAATHGFDFIWRVVPRYETHPPFYYSALRLWTLAFGDGLLALRALGLLAGIATLPLLWLGGRALGTALGWAEQRRNRLALAAFVFGCVSIPLVEMAREARPYPLLILVYVSALPVLLLIARERTLKGSAYPLYLGQLLLVLWLHNLGVLFGAALGCALLIAIMRPGFTRGDWLKLVAGHLLVGLLYLPALAILRDQAPTWIGSTWLAFDWSKMPDRLGTLYAVPGWQAVAGVALLVLAIVKARERPIAMLLVLAILPVTLSIALSLAIAPVFILRTMTPVAAPTLLLLAMGAVAWSDWRRWIGWIAGAMLALNMLAVDLQARAAGPMQNWYGTADWLAAHVRPGDAILAYPNEGALPLGRALRDRRLALPIRPVPTAVPSFDEDGGWYPTGSRGVVALPPARLRAIVDAPATRAVPTVWLLRLGPEMYDKDDAFLRILQRDRYVLRRRTDGPIDLIGLRRRDLPPPAPDRNRR